MGRVQTAKATAEQIGEFRKMFYSKLENVKPPCGEFHPMDMERVKANDLWMGKFLDHTEINYSESLDMLWTTMNWRKTIGANEMDETKIRMDYIESGAMFTHNRDVDGKVLLIVRVKFHTKGSKDINELVNILVYWLERIQRETNYDTFTLFFDLQGAGLSNLDFEFMKKIIDIVKQYPYPVNHIIVFEMAWILNAAFKIIKGLLPPRALKILKVVNTKTLQEFVDADNCLKDWGGNDDYVFKFEPEKRRSAASNNNSISTINNNVNLKNYSQLNVINKDDGLDSSSIAKKVTFSDSIKMQTEEIEELYNRVGHEVGDHNEKMLRITPCDLILFTKKEGETDVTGSVEIFCIARENITYKIKTTSPEKFLVRPSSGILQPGTSAKINVALQKNHSLVDINKDKFLVMSTYLPENMDVHASHNQITELWKSKNGNSPRVENHRLKCVSTAAENVANPAEGVKADTMLYRADETIPEQKQPSGGVLLQLLESNKRIERHAKRSHILQMLTLLAVIIMITIQIYAHYEEIFVTEIVVSPKSSEL